MSSLGHQQIPRLAQRISAGEVVFFVGAGFSLDSEGNSTEVLIARLLVRFEALCEVLRDHGRPDQQTQVSKLQRGLRATFKLGTVPDDENAVNDLFDAQIRTHLTKLADSYYQINEWCCAAFDELLHLLCDAQPADFMQKTAAAEVRLHAALLSRQPNLAAGADDQAAEATRLTSQRLQAAVNELLVLMTPARWDYGEVGLRTTVEDGRPALGFSAEGDARADLLLNTAELSDFSLVLFLLLAPRVDNQLRLLILDDPLQNMDEMKVCTLARALAGLIAIYPPGWSVLALFHGMDDMERIREEAPSAVYHLPWARPLDTQGVERPIGARTDLGTWQRSTQPLDKLLRDAAQPARRRERPGSILSTARRN